MLKSSITTLILNNTQRWRIYYIFIINYYIIACRFWVTIFIWKLIWLYPNYLNKIINLIIIIFSIMLYYFLLCRSIPVYFDANAVWNIISSFFHLSNVNPVNIIFTNACMNVVCGAVWLAVIELSQPLVYTWWFSKEVSK